MKKTYPTKSLNSLHGANIRLFFYSPKYFKVFLKNVPIFTNRNTGINFKIIDEENHVYDV